MVASSVQLNLRNAIAERVSILSGEEQCTLLPFISSSQNASIAADKPLGFSGEYLLPGEEPIVNQAVADSVSALMRQKTK